MKASTPSGLLDVFLNTVDFRAVPEEDKNFQPTHSGVDYPVGYVDFDQQEGSFEADHRLVYPALRVEKSRKWLVTAIPMGFVLIDENESPDNYMLISTRRSAGTMVYIHTGTQLRDEPNMAKPD